MPLIQTGSELTNEYTEARECDISWEGGMQGPGVGNGVCMDLLRGLLSLGFSRSDPETRDHMQVVCLGGDAKIPGREGK